MATEYGYDPNDKQTFTRKTVSGTEAADAATAANVSTTAGKGLGAMAKAAKTPMPKMSDYPGDVKAYGEAMRKWRAEQDADPENVAQKRALGKMQ